MPPIEQNKIDNFLKEWNKNLGRADNPIWVEVEGLSSFIKVSYSPTTAREILFHPNEGYVVKAFLNKETGEVKTFSASLFTEN